MTRDTNRRTRKYTATPVAETHKPTEEGVLAALAGRPLVRLPHILKREACVRCQEKNEVRRTCGLDEDPEEFEDGERVTLFAVYRTDEDDRGHWSITAAHHTRHPMKPKAEAESPEVAQAQLRAELIEAGYGYPIHPHPGSENEPWLEYSEDEMIVAKPVVEWFSPIGEGEETEPIREPDEHGMIELKPTDPRPDWPASENAWRKRVMQEAGEWNDEVPHIDLADVLNNDRGPHAGL